MTCGGCCGRAGREKKKEYLVNVRLFLGERELGDALVLDPDEEVVMEELLDEGVLEGGVGAIRGAEGGDGVVIEEERGEEGCGVAVVDGGDGVWQDPRPLGALAGVRTLSGVGAGHRGCHRARAELLIKSRVNHV